MKPYYQDNSVTIFNGEALSVLPDIPAGGCDVLMTDPPYSSGGAFRGDRAADPATKYRGWSQNSDGSGSRKPTAEYGTFGGDSRDQWSWIRWSVAWASMAMHAVRSNGHVFMFTDWRQLPATTDVLQFGGWTWQGVLVWDKGVGRPNTGRFRNHIEFVVWGTRGGLKAEEGVYPSALIAVPTVGPGEREHVTQKPVALLSHLLTVLPKGPLTILDPFAGSGSTLVAAKQAGHRAVGVEIEERYCEIAAKRCAAEMDFGTANAPAEARRSRSLQPDVGQEVK